MEIMSPTQLKLFDLELFDDLKRYLDDKKESIKQTLLIAIPIELINKGPSLPFPEQRSLSLIESVKAFDDDVKKMKSEDLRRVNFEQIGDRLSEGLKGLVEILEGMSKELFEQLKHSEVDRWNSDFCENVSQAKELIHESCIELKTFINDLEDSLKQFYLRGLKEKSAGFITRLKVKMHAIIDPSLLNSLNRCDKNLTEKFKQFASDQKYINQNLSRIEGNVYRFQSYQAFSNLDTAKKNLFVRLWRLLQLYHLATNDNKKVLPYIENTIKTIAPSGKAFILFKDYYNQIKHLSYEIARTFRGKREISAQAILVSIRSEVQLLETTVDSYRQFLQLTDPNPYARRRNRFTEWLVGPEPRRLKELRQLSANTIAFDHKLADLFDAQEGDDERTLHDVLDQFIKIDRLLHEMGQPLISRPMMAKKTEELTKRLKDVNEITAPLAETSLLMQDAVIRSLRLDSKHLTLLENSSFKDLVETHQGLFGESNSLNHLKRMKLYRKVLDHLKAWVLKHELSKRTHEAEVEIHDIQETLQEFYHSLPQLSKKDAPLKEQVIDLKRQLLQERLIFSLFFTEIKNYEHESRILQAEMQFVDPYFDAIETKLHAYRNLLAD